MFGRNAVQEYVISLLLAFLHRGCLYAKNQTDAPTVRLNNFFHRCPVPLIFLNSGGLSQSQKELEAASKITKGGFKESFTVFP